MRYMRSDDDFSSPTTSLESSLMTLLIDAKESIDAAVADVPGAYLHASFPPEERVVLELNGVFVDIMCSVNPLFENHVVYERNRRGRYTKVL